MVNYIPEAKLYPLEKTGKNSVKWQTSQMKNLAAHSRDFSRERLHYKI